MNDETEVLRVNRPTLWYVADPMCSWCWGFSPVIEAIQKDYSDRLDVSLLVGGLRPGTASPMTSGQREEILHHWHEVHRRTGQPFLFEGAMPEGFVYDTEPACRAVVAVSSLNPDLAFPYFKGVQRAFYADRKDVTKPEVLAAAAKTQGLAAGDFFNRFHSGEIHRKTRDHFRQAQRWGVQGFPTLVLQKASELSLLTRGYQPLEHLRPRLEEWMEAK